MWKPWPPPQTILTETTALRDDVRHWTVNLPRQVQDDLLGAVIAVGVRAAAVAVVHEAERRVVELLQRDHVSDVSDQCTA